MKTRTLMDFVDFTDLATQEVFKHRASRILGMLRSLVRHKARNVGVESLMTQGIMIETAKTIVDQSFVVCYTALAKAIEEEE